MEDRLRWALSDTQILMGTLLQIIAALREIITELDTKFLTTLRAPNDMDLQEITEKQRNRAKSYKELAETQFDRVDQRRRLLETLWDQAHGTLQHLAIHAEVMNIPSIPEDLSPPTQPLLPSDFLSQPELIDIANALGKVDEFNTMEERTALELQKAIKAPQHLPLDDDMPILIAATRLKDHDARLIALRTLVKSWPSHPDTRDALSRAAHDEKRSIGLLVASSLSEHWKGDAVARDTLASMVSSDDDAVRQSATRGLVQGWAMDPAARKALVDATRSSDAQVRETAATALTEGWGGDTVARDVLIALTRDEDVYVRIAATEGIIDRWIGDAVARESLEWAAGDVSPTVRWAAREALARCGILVNACHEPPQSSSVLLTVRLPPNLIINAPSSLTEKLHRGISFETGITVILGGNGSGKTTLLNALELIAPHNSRRSKSPIHVTDLSRNLADFIQVAWNPYNKLNAMYYMTATDRRWADWTRSHRLSLAENWANYWNFTMQGKPAGPNNLFLFDEPGSALDFTVQKLLHERLKEIVERGSQVIIATVNHRWLEIPGVRCINL
ncbi:HEAT repeat domain-containing protein, partial [Streptomyces halstedii]|uniref:HEAT repeat domain-containing protein n=1 Tax=Streptomyces halstedii TaxID=1944 RepID=UPI0033474D68